MFKNYLKITLRQLARHKLFSFINISGLTIGMACCILIFLYVQDELRFDRFHEKAPRIYRILNKAKHKDLASADHPAVMISHLRNDFPRIERAARLWRRGERLQHKEKYFVEDDFFYADQDILDIFTLPFAAGKPQDALREPFSVVLSERAARKYFNDQNPIGQTIKSKNKHEFKITGVFKDLPLHSHIRPDFLASFASLKTLSPAAMENWSISGTLIYLLLREGTSAKDLEAEIDILVAKHRDGRFNSTLWIRNTIACTGQNKKQPLWCASLLPWPFLSRYSACSG